MNLSVFNPILNDKTLDEALAYLSSHGVMSVELGCGGFPGTVHADAKVLIADDKKLNELKATFDKYNMSICALSTHCNPVHPNIEVANQAREDFNNTCQLASKLGIKTIVTFSGCPGDSDTSQHPNWVTCSWPDDFAKVLEYQWNEKLIPYWREACDYAKSCGVERIALEMHPGFCVYNPDTLLRLRNAVSNMIGANFDPSHLIWQGINPADAIRYLGDCIYHFHAKDTKIDVRNNSVNGVLDTKSYTDEINRSWVFRTVGYGMEESKWREIISMLAKVNYKYAISIEHEDSLMSANEGLEKAIAFLQNIMIKEGKPDSISWA